MEEPFASASPPFNNEKWLVLHNPNNEEPTQFSAQKKLSVWMWRAH
jgi:hypothetical protein